MPAIHAFPSLRWSARATPPGQAPLPRAAAEVAAMLGDGRLVREDEPLLFRCHEVVPHDGRTIDRRGFIAAVDFAEAHALLPEGEAAEGEGPLLAHYVDDYHTLDRHLVDVERHPPLLDLAGPDGYQGRLWRIASPEAHEGILDFIAGVKVMVASPPTAGARRLALLCPTVEPGVVVRPVHRVLRGPALERDSFLRAAGEFFRPQLGPLASPSILLQGIAGHGKKSPTVAMLTPGADSVAYLKLRGDLIKSSVPALSESTALADLDVRLLHGLVLESLLHVYPEAQAERVEYLDDVDAALARLGEPGVQAVFLVNPPTLGQVANVAAEGRRLPPRTMRLGPPVSAALVADSRVVEQPAAPPAVAPPPAVPPPPAAP